MDQGKNDNQEQIVIPLEKFKISTVTPNDLMTMEMKRAIMLHVYNHPTAGHPGHDDTIRKTRALTMWEGMNEWITEYVKGCAVC